MIKLKNKVTIFTDLAREAIVMGETTRAISLMLENIEKSKEKEFKGVYDDICILSNSLNQTKRNKRLGIIQNEEANIEFNRINNSLIELISNFESKLDLNGIQYSQNNISISSIPRNGVPDKLYYGFVILGFSCGIICITFFMIMYYNYLTNPSNKIEELLFLGTLGFLSSTCLSGALDGLNRRKGDLINWKIILPQIIIAVMFSIIAGIFSLLR